MIYEYGAAASRHVMFWWCKLKIYVRNFGIEKSFLGNILVIHSIPLGGALL